MNAKYLSAIFAISCLPLFCGESADEKLATLQNYIRKQDRQFYTHIQDVDLNWLNEHKEDLHNAISQAKAALIGVKLNELPQFEEQCNQGMSFDQVQSLKHYQEVFQPFEHMKEAIKQQEFNLKVAAIWKKH